MCFVIYKDNDKINNPIKKVAFCKKNSLIIKALDVFQYPVLIRYFWINV